ncbi:hypothetical protein [Serratia grimesii]|uniref:hypothetical protein n=1 Tax=Serratia grimesii TaxID=82995 RepID=UPI00077C94FA|nr:hypothetical protein [Serratia grimesii]CAI0794688.1 Uncharacterised protein [Serratia grimesii]CAI2462547.1 Uncharacterised protein [Serratia grimesii]SUI32057.1 Uncharacterised protein [Serratia grimesii]
MTTSPLSAPFAASAQQQAQTNAGILLFSGLVAQVALLLKLYALESPLLMVALLACFIIAFVLAVFLMQLKVFKSKSRLSLVRQGFVISAMGTLLLLLLALHGLPNGLPLFSAMAISGVGQGMVYSAAIRPGNNKDGHVLRRRALLLAGSLLAVVAVLLIQSSFTGITGFSYAFALLIDLSLLAALYVRVVELES